MSVRFLATCFIHSPLGSDVIPVLCQNSALLKWPINQQLRVWFVAVPRAEHEQTTKSCRHSPGRPETDQVRGARMNK